MLESLNGEWLTFQQILLDSEQMLKKHKEKFKTGLIHAADDFKKKAHNLLEDFEVKGANPPLSFFPKALVLGTQHSKRPGKGEGRGWGRGLEKCGGTTGWAAQQREEATVQNEMSLLRAVGFWLGGLGQKCFYLDFLSSTAFRPCSPVW